MPRPLEGRIEQAHDYEGGGVSWYFMRGHDVDKAEFAAEVNTYFKEDPIEYTEDDVTYVHVRNVPSGFGEKYMFMYPAQAGKRGAYPITMIDRDMVQVQRLQDRMKTERRQDHE